MKNLSTDFKRALATKDHNYLAYADITWPASANINPLHLTNSELWSGGFSYEEVVSDDEEFTALGSANIGTATIIINNMDESYSEYDFTNAQVVLSIAMQFTNDDTTRTETHKIGTYHVDEVRYNGALVTLTLLDNMEQFDRPYSNSLLMYPATLGQIIYNACLNCGVTLNTPNFPHSTFTIDNRPVDDAITFRDVISWAAGIAGCFAKCNPDGELEIKWFNQQAIEEQLLILDGGTITPWSEGENYDGGTINPWSTGDSYDGGEGERTLPIHYITSLYSQEVALDDVIITGITIEIDNNVTSADASNIYRRGTTGYVLSISGNKLITSDNVTDIIDWLAAQLIQLRFRKLRVTCLDDPSIESGDVALVYDRKGRGYIALITRTSFSIGSPQEIVSGASTPSRNSATSYSQWMRNLVETRRLLRQQQTAYDQAIENLSQRLNVKAGLYSTIEVTESGNIYYLHDQPDLDDSAIVWKMTRDAWGVTTNYDGDDTVWNGGMTVDGDAITRILTSVGINADWINAGQVAANRINARGLTVVDDNDNTTFSIDSNGNVTITPTTFALANGDTIQSIAQTIAASAAADPASKLTQDDIIELLQGTQQQAIYVDQNGQIYISATYIQGLKLSAIQADIQDLSALNASIGGFVIGNNTLTSEKEIQGSDYKFALHSLVTNDGMNTPMLYAQQITESTDAQTGTTTTTTTNLLELQLDGSIVTRSSTSPSTDNILINGATIDLRYGNENIRLAGNGILWHTGNVLTPKLAIRLNSNDVGFNFTNDIIFDRQGMDIFKISTVLYAYTNLNMNGNNVINTSDRRLKTNIVPVDNVLSKLLSCDVVSFDWKESGKHVGAGVIAQDIEHCLPDLVSQDDNGIYGVNYTGFIPYLIKAVQEQQEQLNEKDKRIEELEHKMSVLESHIERLENLLGRLA